jgi:hypothetical protein
VLGLTFCASLRGCYKYAAVKQIFAGAIPTAIHLLLQFYPKDM